MRIAVNDVGHAFGRQTRAYAEYRIFSSLVRFSDIVRDANVSLTPAPVEGHTALCCVEVTIEHGRRLRVSARGRHAYDAINRAAQRIGDAVRRHTDVALSS